MGQVVTDRRRTDGGENPLTKRDQGATSEELVPSDSLREQGEPALGRGQTRTDNALAEQVKALEAENRALREAQGELLELLRPLGETCLTCGREMVEYGRGDDRNCGGDCWGCIKSVEEWTA